VKIAAAKCFWISKQRKPRGHKKPANYAGDALMKMELDPGIRDVNWMQENKILLQKGV
jgi:hypothetical protein